MAVQKQSKESSDRSLKREGESLIESVKAQLRALYPKLPADREDIKGTILELLWVGMTSAPSFSHNVQCAKMLGEMMALFTVNSKTGKLSYLEEFRKERAKLQA